MSIATREPKPEHESSAKLWKDGDQSPSINHSTLTTFLRKSWKYALLSIVAGLLILAHGCHGDEDDELFTSAIKYLQQAVK